MFKFYYSILSQPSRALWIAFKMSKTPFEEYPVALGRLEHLSKKFKAVNRFQRVPCIVDGDFHLAESVAIVRYLTEKGQFSTLLYPTDIKQRARVNEFLSWQHLGLRYGCATYCLHTWLMPVSGLADPPSAEEKAVLLKRMEDNLQIVENVWLKDSQFVSGPHLTVADLFGACEIEQTRLTKYDVKAKFPKVADWLLRVREQANPFYGEAHKLIEKKANEEITFEKSSITRKLKVWYLNYLRGQSLG